MSYVEIPFLLKYYTCNRNKPAFNIFIGPAADLLLNSELGTVNAKDNTMKIDGSLIFGGGVDIPAGNESFMLEGRYIYGLTSIDDSGADLNVKSRVISILVGYSFGQ